MENQAKDSNPHKVSLIAIYLFYDYSAGIQAKLAFSKDFRHCNTVVYDGKNYIAVEFDSQGIQMRVIKARQLSTLFKGLKIIPELTAMVCVEISERKRVAWKPWWVRSCNELSRYVTGIDTGWTFNPKHFYNLLLRYDDKRNYKILDAWRR